MTDEKPNFPIWPLFVAFAIGLVLGALVSFIVIYDSANQEAIKSGVVAFCDKNGGMPCLDYCVSLDQPFCDQFKGQLQFPNK